MKFYQTTFTDLYKGHLSHVTLISTCDRQQSSEKQRGIMPATQRLLFYETRDINRLSASPESRRILRTSFSDFVHTYIIIINTTKKSFSLLSQKSLIISARLIIRGDCVFSNFKNKIDSPITLVFIYQRLLFEKKVGKRWKKYKSIS